jgi:hypothetical protein
MNTPSLLRPVLKPEGLKILKRTAGELIQRVKNPTGNPTDIQQIVSRVPGQQAHRKLMHQGRKQWERQVQQGLDGSEALKAAVAKELRMPLDKVSGQAVIQRVRKGKHFRGTDSSSAIGTMFKEHPEWFVATRQHPIKPGVLKDNTQLTLQPNGRLEVLRQKEHRQGASTSESNTKRVFTPKGALTAFERTQKKETIDKTGMVALQDKRIFDKQQGYEPSSQRHNIKQTFFRTPQTFDTEDIDGTRMTIPKVEERITLNQRIAQGDLSYVSHRISDTLNTNTRSYTRQHGITHETNPYDTLKDGRILETLKQRHEIHAPQEYPRTHGKTITMKEPRRTVYGIKSPWEYSQPEKPSIQTRFGAVQESSQLPLVESLTRSSNRHPDTIFAKNTTTVTPLTTAPLNVTNTLPEEFNSQGKQMVTIPMYEGKMNPLQPAMVNTHESFKITPLQGNVPAIYQHVRKTDVRSLPTTQELPTELTEPSALNRFQFSNKTTRANNKQYPEYVTQRTESRVWRERPIDNNPDGDVPLVSPTPVKPLAGVS